MIVTSDDNSRGNDEAFQTSPTVILIVFWFPVLAPGTPIAITIEHLVQNLMFPLDHNVYRAVHLILQEIPKC